MPYTASADTYAQRSVPVNSFARGAAAVVTSDTADLATYAKRLYIGVSGDVAVIPVANYALGSTTPVVFKAVPVGYLDVQVARVMATATTATNIVALSA